MQEPVQSGIRMRTCIATRRKAPDVQLLRVVADPSEPGVIKPDPSRRLPGRGAWLTPTIEALDLAESRRAFSRALRVSGTPDTDLVRTYLEVHTEQ